MASQQGQTAGKENGRSGAPSLELHLSRAMFPTGGHISGVAVLRLSRATDLRSVAVSVDGRETPKPAGLTRKLRRSSVFFHRDLLLSGKEQPRRTGERVSQFWNAVLGRNGGRILSAGEHVYPFTIPLPGSLPPSYDGRAGRITYTVTARMLFPVGSSTKVARDAQVVYQPRSQRGRPIALSYPNANGAVQESELSVNLELPCRDVEAGGSVAGRVSIANPQRTPIEKISLTLESCEWVRPSSEKGLQRELVDSLTITPDDPAAEASKLDFELKVPENAPPTVEGAAISVIWLLKLSLTSTPPVELKTPITVYRPAPE